MKTTIIALIFASLAVDGTHLIYEMEMVNVTILVHMAFKWIPEPDRYRRSAER
jgi:hypothetical protein